MKSKDDVLLENIYKHTILKETATLVVAHGFSDSGISSFRYTIIDPHIKLNQRLKHGIFEEDYITITHNSLDEAYNELVNSLQDDKLDLLDFKKDFVGELLRNNTVVVYSFHKGNHFDEHARTLLVREDGRWDEVPVHLEDIPSHSIIKEYETAEEDDNLKTGIPYDEIVPSREQEGYSADREIIKIPMTKALKIVIDRYEHTVKQWVAAARQGMYNAGQMQSVKDDEEFVSMLKQGKLYKFDTYKLGDYLYHCANQLPQHKEELMKLRKFITDSAR